MSAPEATLEYAPALRQLQSLQKQIESLRPAMASLVETFTTPRLSNVSTTQLYTNFATAATQAVKDVKKFRTDWEDPKSQEALENARASLQVDGDLDWDFISTGRWRPLEGLDDTNTNTAPQEAV